MAYQFNKKKYEEIAKRMFGGFTPYNPPDSSYYRNLGYQVYKQKEEEKKRKKTTRDIMDEYDELKERELLKGQYEEKEKEEPNLIDKIKSLLGSDNKEESKQKDKKKEKKKDKKQNSFLDDILTPLKRYGQGVKNLFDGDPDTKFSDAFKAAVEDAMSTERSKVTKELNRGFARAANTATLGALDEIYKKTHGERASQFKDRDGGGAVADLAYDALGYLIPGAGAYKTVRGAGLGLKEGAKGLTKARQLAQEGALTGLGMSAAEVGIREGLNPKDYNAKENLKHIGIGTAAGAIADPALYVAGKGVQKALSRFAKGDVPTYTGKVSEETLEKMKPSYKTASISSKSDVIDRLMKTIKSEPAATMETPSLKQKLEYETIRPFKEKNIPLKRVDSIEQVSREPIDIENAKYLVRQQIDTSGKREKQKWSFDRFMTAVVDDLRPIDKATRDLGGKTLETSKNPYIQARLARGVAGKAETFLRGGIYDKSGKKVGKSLQEIIKPIENDMDDFLSYITAKRALDYDAKGLKAGIKPKDVEGISDWQLADATIRQIETEKPQFKQIQKELVEYSHRLLDELQDSGILSKEAVEQIKKENPNYVPMFRVQEPRVRGFEPLYPKNRYANLGKATQKRTGSERQIINPIESMIKNTYLMLNMAERNKVGRSLLDLIEQSGENMWGRVVKQDKGLSLDELTDSLDKANVELNDGKADAVDNLFKGEGNKVYVYKDGKKVELELQEDLYRAMLSLDAPKQNFFIKLLSVPTKMLRTGAVLSPDFGPVNIFRDQFSAFINSKYGFIPFVDMFRGLTNVLKKDDIYWQWKNSGGANSVLSSLDREYLQKDLRKMIKQSMGERIKDRLKHPIDTVLAPLRTVSEITEEATRVGEFKKGLKKGASPEEAAFASRDLIDFSRAGYLGRQYNQVTAFFNAAVQSMDKLARTFKENPVGATVRALMSITLPSIVAYMYNHDKEWYKEIPQRERDLYWHFQVGDQIYKLPKPFEAGVLFGTTMERFLDFIRTNDPKAFKNLDKTIKDTFTPPWLPTALTPWIEVYANKSMYFDSPIVPRREENLLPEDQYGPYQSEVGKLLGKVLDTSPRKVDHVIKGYTGGLGGYALRGIDWASQLSGNNRPQLPDRGLADAPVINRFVVKNLEGNNQSINDFYELMDQVRRERMSAKKNKVPYQDEGLYKLLNKINRDISELQAQKRDIIQDPNMNGKQKAAEIREIDDVITRLAKLGITQSGR
jgi:actin-related protein